MYLHLNNTNSNIAVSSSYDRTGEVGFVFCNEKYISHCLASYGGHWGETEIKVGSTVLILAMDPGRYSKLSGVIKVLLPTGQVGYMFGHEIKKL